MGFDGLFFARLHFEDKAERKKRKALEMVWRGSRNLGPDNQLLTSVLFYHYCPPPGFCFDSIPTCQSGDISVSHDDVDDDDNDDDDDTILRMMMTRRTMMVTTMIIMIMTMTMN